MKLVLLRHGHRDLTHDSDGGLNRAGKELASELPKKLKPHGQLLIPTILLSSPKRRAKETLQPLSETLNIPLEVNDDLDERRNAESSSQFRTRVRKFIELLPKKFKSNDVLYLCSHADWLEEAMIVLESNLRENAEIGFACGEMRTFELSGA